MSYNEVRFVVPVTDINATVSRSGPDGLNIDYTGDFTIISPSNQSNFPNCSKNESYTNLMLESNYLACANVTSREQAQCTNTIGGQGLQLSYYSPCSQFFGGTSSSPTLCYGIPNTYTTIDQGTGLADFKLPLTCVYDMTQMTVDQLSALASAKTSVQDQDNFNYNYYKALAYYCSQQETNSANCPIDPNTNPLTNMPSCSRILSTASSGICSDLGNSDNVFFDQGSVMTSYCSNYNTPDCACINRNSDPNYQAVAGTSASGLVSCWYLPCKDTSAYLIPPDISKPAQGACTDVCATVQYFLDNSGTDVQEQIQQSVRCDIKGPQVEGAINKPQNSTSQTSSNTSTSSNDSISIGYRIAMILLLVGLIFVFVYIFFSKY